VDRLTVLAAILLAGCDIGTGSVVGGVASERGVNNGDLPEDCTKIEGSDLGSPVTLTAGGVTVEITGWISKDGEPGEYVGFTYTADGPTDITIKAGTEVFVEDGDGTWIHPAGTFGSDAGGISNVVVCEGEEEPVEEEPKEEPGDCTDESDVCNNPPLPEPPIPDPNTCTTHEDCESGVCIDGHCIVV
jgi:hypothetical protein